MMTSNRWKRYLQPGVHVLAWLLLGFLLLFYIPLTWSVVVPHVFWIWQTMVFVMMVVVFYINAKIIVPQTLLKNRMATFIVWLVGITLLLQLIVYGYTTSTNMKAQVSAALNDQVREDHIIDSFIFTITLIVLGISTSWAMLQNWQRSAHRHQQLEQEKTITELAMLKTQINPHFFFNTLNNIYSLTYINVEDSRKALHTLSRMMRYLLYSTEDEKTSLVKEVGFLRDYILLMRLRTNKLKLIVSIPEDLTDFPIAPMLMIPFVENAFKHGVDATASSEIRIALSQEKQLLALEVENNIFTKPAVDIKEGGIGLANTRRRLELIYPSQYELEAGINNHGNYEVNLQLQLQP